MASLQQTSISLQSKLLPSSQLPRALPSLNVSFSATFPSLKLSTTRPLQGGTKMSASSYATALADVAKSKNTLDATSSDVEKVDKIFSDPQVLDFFANPTIDIHKKRQVLDEIVKSSELQPQTANFLNILVDAKRIDLIKEIVKEFEMVYNKLTDTELAVVSSVVNWKKLLLSLIWVIFNLLYEFEFFSFFFCFLFENWIWNLFFFWLVL
ncbi:hypothetical protein CRYUN_Cryun39dG0059600 [Craigia yunnanensis]